MITVIWSCQIKNHVCICVHTHNHDFTKFKYLQDSSVLYIKWNTQVLNNISYGKDKLWKILYKILWTMISFLLCKYPKVDLLPDRVPVNLIDIVNIFFKKSVVFQRDNIIFKLPSAVFEYLCSISMTLMYFNFHFSYSIRYVFPLILIFSFPSKYLYYFHWYVFISRLQNVR